MISTKITIIGGGLSGLYAAYLLEQAGITDYVLLEARNRLGGRIYSNQGFDLGAAWIWPDINPELMQLLEKLELAAFEQHESGNILIEKSLNSTPIRLPKQFYATQSMRLVNGMDSLIQALKQQIPTHKIITDQQVLDLTIQASGLVKITINSQTRKVSEYQAQHVLLALPPRLASHQLKFNPPLNPQVMAQWANTATWMAPHAKYLAVYLHAFWRQHGLSGEASSHVGPMGEIHDASMPDGQAALFGFFLVPYEVRQQLSEQELMAHCRAQLVRLFGELAAAPTREMIKDWSADPHTATKSDWQQFAMSHSPAPPISSKNDAWENKLVGIGTEWSQESSGYLAGCIDAATVGVKLVMISLNLE